MSSTSETGHAKNVATFEDLISFCTAYGAPFNPSKASLKLTALTAQFTAANAALQAVKAAKTTYDNATNARELIFKSLKPFVTQIIGALSATGATKQTIADAKSTNMKIQGRRVSKVEKPTAEAIAAGAPVAKTVSTSQLSYDKIIDHFAQLLEKLPSQRRRT